MKFLFSLLCLLCCGNAGLRAQNAGETDMAPGSKPETGAPAVSGSASAVATVPAGTSLLSNGDFALATKDSNWPDGWDRGNGVTWKLEGGRHFLRFVSQGPERQVQLERGIHIPPGVRAVEFVARYRTAGLKKGEGEGYDARTIFEFLDWSWKPIGAAPAVVFSEPAATWTNVTERFAVPEGAMGLLITPCLFRVRAGTLDIAEMRVSTLGKADSEAVVAADAEAAAKRAADEEATVEREIAMPSKSEELKVSGNRLVTAEGKNVWLQGVNLSGLELSPKGNHILWPIHVAIDEWKANVIRLPVMDTLWFGHGRNKLPSNDMEAYRTMVDKAVRLAAAKGAYIILDLHRYRAPEDGAVLFWKDAAARYKNNPAVLFDILNEPHDISWEIWRNGGTVKTKAKGGEPTDFQTPGMQALVDAVRGTGAKNIIVAGGIGWAYDLRGIANGYALEDRGGNGIMYSTHFYNWVSGWAEHILAVAAKYPVLVGETGADPHKMDFVPAASQEDPYTWAPDAIGFIQKNKLNWTAWCFHTRATPNMLLDWDYFTPTPFWGAFVKDALWGKQYEMKRMR